MANIILYWQLTATHENRIVLFHSD